MLEGRFCLSKFQQLLKRVPAKLTNTWLATIVIAYLNKKIKKRSHPDGFVANIITDKRETFGLGYGFDLALWTVIDGRFGRL